MGTKYQRPDHVKIIFELDPFYKDEALEARSKWQQIKPRNPTFQKNKSFFKML